MRKLNIILLLLVLVALPMVSAQVKTFELNTDIIIKEPCYNNGTYCSSGAECNLSAFYPNNTVIINNHLMTNQIAFHNYTINSSFIYQSGTYYYDIVCTDNSLSNFGNFEFDVNPQGVPTSIEKNTATGWGTWALLAVAIVLFVSFIFYNESPTIKWSFFLISMMFFISAMNVISISMRNEVVSGDLVNLFDFFAAASIYMYWFAGGLLGLIWIMTFLNTVFYKRNMKAANKFGGSY